MQRQKPRLRAGVDLQLQSAFSDENWATVIQLADKRAKLFKDQYYEILKVCAESRLDDPAYKLSAVSLLQLFTQNGTVVKDVDAINLLEWATLEMVSEDEYLESIGPLRVRSVKASPKEKLAASRSLESCLVHWDLASAQQIAALMDKSFPSDRHFMFWNIAITYLLSTSPQAPSDKQKLYAMLAQKQIERAAQMTEQALSSGEKGIALPARGVQSEEEIILLYSIVESHGSPGDYEKLLQSPVFSPLAQFRKGRKEILLRAIKKQRSLKEWRAIFELCNSCMSDKLENGEHNLLACDYKLWEEFISAASHLKLTDDSVFETVRSLLADISKSTQTQPIYQRNLLLAQVSVALNLVVEQGKDVTDSETISFRLRELMNYVNHQVMNPACFDDVKEFIEQLDKSGLKHILSKFLPSLCEKAVNAQEMKAVELFQLKIRYLITTCFKMYTAIPGVEPTQQCAQCTQTSNFQSCVRCFSEISDKAIDLYQTFTESQLTPSAQELMTEAIILAALCSLKIASPDPKMSLTMLPTTTRRHVLHAIMMLEHHREIVPKNSQILLLLLQLHLLSGSAPRSSQLFEDLSIKRTIMDSLGPIFYDRLSVLAPNLLSPNEDQGWMLMDALTGHYQVSLKLRMPRRLVDAFESESYSSVIEVPKYMTDLRSSCTRAISCVEETRSERILGCPTWELLSDVRFIEVSDETNLNAVIDYGSFPSWDSKHLPPVYERLRIGPPPTNERLHLSLLSEAFHDVLGYKAPAMYKVPANNIRSNQQFVIESLSRISNSFGKFLPGCPEASLTCLERIYFEIISLLSTLVILCASGKPSSIEETIIQMAEAVQVSLGTLRTKIGSDEGNTTEGTVSLLSSMYNVGSYRDAASAMSVAAQYVLDLTDRMKEQDRTGQNHVPKSIMSKLKLLHSDSREALQWGKSLVANMQRQMGAGFEKDLKAWALEECSASIGNLVGASSIDILVESMKENIKGWQQVKWE